MWTAEEEAALQEGVAKHGRGKWTEILEDPEFAATLANRSNISLKDKWENLCGDQGPGGSSGTTKTPKAIASASSEEVDITGISGSETSKAITTASNEEVDITGCSGNKTPEAIATASSGEVHKTESNATETPEAIATASIDEVPITEISSASEEIFSDSTTESSHGRRALTCREMVLEVLTLMKHDNPLGSEFPAIASFIELKNGVPWSQDFRNKVGSELQMLVSEGLVEKVVLGYRITAAGMEVLPPILSETEDSPVASTSAPVIPNSFQEASEQAAQLIAEAERATFLAHVAAREAERFSQQAQDMQALVALGQEFLARCCRGENVVFKE